MPNRRARAALLSIGALHVALATWAASAWIGGPFEGRGILDGFEVLELARSGSTGAFATKSPLYPALLGLLLDLFGSTAWTVAVLGIVISTLSLVLIGNLATRVTEEPWAGPLAAAFWALSGSVYAFVAQPLPVGLATLFALASASLWLKAQEQTSWTAVRIGAFAGALAAAAAFTRAPLALIAAGWISVALWRREFRFGLAFSGGALVATAVAFMAFGADAWPRGGAFNLRMGNGPERTGISDVRPGPAYDRVRYQGTFADVDPDGLVRDPDAVQLELLVDECRADLVGTSQTIGRKAWLFGHWVETHTAADFRHGLRDLPWFGPALVSLALIFPLALASRVLWGRPILWIPVACVFAANVIYLTSARYRFPALPFLCVAAAAFLFDVRQRSPRAARLGLALVFGLLFGGPWTSVPLRFPGDGAAQEAHSLLASANTPERARVLLEEALELGNDPRAAYDLGLYHERLALAREDRAELERANELYARALELDPLYPQAAENYLRGLLRLGLGDEAREFARATIAANPYAGFCWLNLAELEEGRAPQEEVDRLRAQGHSILALRRLAQNGRVEGRRHALEARRLGRDDPRFAPLFEE